MYKFLILLAIPSHPTSAASALAPHDSVSITRQTPDLSGTYVLDPSRSDDPAQSAKAATSSIRRFRRNAIQKRMNDEMKPADTLRVAIHADTVVLTTSGRLHLATVPGATPKSRSGQKGGTAELASAWQGDTLVVTTSSEKFQREARYSRDTDGTSIRIAITMSTAASGKSIHYVLVYRRLAGRS